MERKSAPQYYLGLRDKMMREGSASKFTMIFMSLNCNANRIRFCYETLKGAGMLPKADWSTEKSEGKSIKAREQGNHLFLKEKDYSLALEAYNESLCYAPPNSDCVSIAYANRSAVYFNAGFFEYCLENIDLALEHGYPDRLKAKLLQRKENCLKLMNNEKDSLETYGAGPKLKLSYAANPKLPFAIDALRLADNEQFGRHIVTSQALLPGDVVIIEKPFFQTLHKGSVYSHCTNCAFNHFFNLRPCPKSTKAMFCSDSCAKEAWKRFYKFEYPVLEGLFELFTDISIDSIRATLRTFTMFDSFTELKAFIAEIDENETIFDTDYSKADERAKFRSIYGMATNETKRSVDDLMHCANFSAIAWHVFKECTDMKEILEDGELEDLFLELLMRFYQIVAVGFHETAETLRRSQEDEAEATPFSPRVYGSGAFALSGLINHSCIPNLNRTSVAGLNILIVARPIQPGGQLFDSYGPLHDGQTRNERQAILRNQYHFECKCDACIQDYPTFDKMLCKNLIPSTIIQNSLDLEYNEKTKILASALFKQICKFMAEHDKHTPSYDIFKLHQYFVSLLRVLFYPKPLELILMPRK